MTEVWGLSDVAQMQAMRFEIASLKRDRDDLTQRLEAAEAELAKRIRLQQDMDTIYTVVNLEQRLAAAEGSESTLASLCDWTNTHCRDCGVAEAEWYTLAMMRDAIDRIVFFQRDKSRELQERLAKAEARCERHLRECEARGSEIDRLKEIIARNDVE